MIEEKYRVLLLDTKSSNPNHYICIGIEKALRNSEAVEKVFRVNYSNAIPVAIHEKCNLFIAFDGEEMNRELCQRLAHLCGISVLWVTEDPYEINTNIANSDIFDLVFSNDAASVEKYGSKGCHLPFAASQELHYLPVKQQDEDYLYDILFIGTAWPNRVEFFKKILPELSDLRVKIALPYNEHLKAPDLSILPSSYLWRTPNTEFCRMANRSRVVITLHRHFTVSDGGASASTPGPRLFEVALAGGFQLIDMSLPEVANYYEQGTEFEGFTSASECIEKVRYYCENAQERIACVEKAQAKTLAKHLYDHRVQVILEKVSACDKKRKAEQANLAPVAIKKRPVLLFVSHNIIGISPYGGVEVYQDLMIQKMSAQYDMYIYVPDRKYPNGKKYNLYNAKYEIVEEFNFSQELSTYTLCDQQREEVFSQIVTKYQVNLVHFQHLIGHVPSLPFITKALGVPSLMTLHDYWVICAHFNLIGYQNRFCNISCLPEETCDVCLHVHCNAEAGSQAVRRAFMAKMLAQLDRVLINTEGGAGLFKEMFPVLAMKNTVYVRGIPIKIRQPGSLAPRSAKPLQVAILGNFTMNKGADTLIYVFDQMRNDDIHFHVFGAGNACYDTILEQLKIANVTCYGEYSIDKIFDQLQEMSVSLHLSIWPETYVLTLSEAWQAGLVPIVTDIGALGERVSHGENGFKVPVNQPGSVIALLRNLLMNPDKLERVREQLTGRLYELEDEHIAWLDKIYEEFVPANLSQAEQPITISLKDCGILLNQTSWMNGKPCNNPLGGRRSSAKRLVIKALKYAKKHGFKAMLRRSLTYVQNRL